ncbi:MAG: Dps family protein [Patescibacteria group bacterium]
MKTTLDTTQIKTILDTVFASVYDLYFKTHSSHWNVVAQDFHELHIMLEGQYTYLWGSLDEIAERYRVFGLTAPTQSVSVDASLSTAVRDELLGGLLTTAERTIDVLRTSINTLDTLGDLAGADLLTGMLATHEKHAWMIRSSL